jgi:hypothetical protein
LTGTALISCHASWFFQTKKFDVFSSSSVKFYPLIA